MLRPFARELSALLRYFLAGKFGDISHVFALWVHTPKSDWERPDEKKFIRLPVLPVAWAAAILATLPGSQRGAPKKAATSDALNLLNEGMSSRKAAKIIADRTGEPFENIRARLRNLKRVKKRAKNSPEGRGK